MQLLVDPPGMCQLVVGDQDGLEAGLGLVIEALDDVSAEHGVVRHFRLRRFLARANSHQSYLSTYVARVGECCRAAAKYPVHDK